MKKAIIIIVWVLIQSVACNGQGWFELGMLRQWGTGPGSICEDSSGNLYCAGGMIDSPTLEYGRCYVAKWDHIAHIWSELGIGSNRLMANEGISGMVMDKMENIYVGGSFTDSTFFDRPAGHCYVAKWNGSNWSQLGTGSNALNADGTINTMCIDDSGNIYVAGNFRNSFGQSYVAKWNGTNWSELFGLNCNLFIYSVCVDDSFNVYAAGDFKDIDGHVYVAKYSAATSTWSELGTGFDSGSYELGIRSIFTDTPNHVYAALNCDHGVAYSNVFKWDGSNWSELGTLNANHYTQSICKGDSGFVYATGLFKNSMGMNYIAQWNPHTNNWTEFIGSSAPVANQALGGLYMDKRKNLYVAGKFLDTSFSHFFVAEYGISTLEVKGIQNDNNLIEVYPNPATMTVNFEFPQSANITIRLMDITGRVLSEQQLEQTSKTTFDISSFKPGLYLYQVATDNIRQTGKIVVE